MVRWVVGSILHGGPTSYFSFQPLLHNWCNKGRRMCYPVCGMMNIKEPLLQTDNVDDRPWQFGIFQSVFRFFLKIRTVS